MPGVGSDGRVQRVHHGHRPGPRPRPSLTADAVRKPFVEGRTVNAQQALKRTMVNRLVPYPSEAMAYAGGYASRLRAEEDADRGRRIRILERELELEQQRQADIDYCETRLRLTDTE